MTVMPASGEVADKAVSTEDTASNVEVARLEAVLAALVETKVESMKAAASTTTTTTTTTTRRVGSAPASPRRPRLTSSSTASSSQNHYHHHHHHHHHGHHHHKPEKKKREERRHRRHDSAPCGELIEDLVAQNGHHRSRHGGKGHRRDSEQPIKSPRKRRRHSRSPQGPQVLPNLVEGPSPDPGLTLLRINGDHHLDLLNFDRASETFGESHEFPRLQQSSCYFSQSATQLKIHYEVDDYVALNLDDDLDDEEESRKKGRGPCDRYHRPKRKRKRRRRRVGPEGGGPEELVDPEELPPRARWTIVATAFLLLAMSLLLVGVTLRMAPIIDDMGDGRRASVCRKNRPKRASTIRRKGSIRAGNSAAIYTEGIEGSGKEVEELTPMSLVEIAQDRSRRKIVTIVLIIFIFLLVASILIVVITLTHSTFHSLPNEGANSVIEEPQILQENQLRRENEELLNSLSRDSFVPDNITELST